MKSLVGLLALVAFTIGMDAFAIIQDPGVRTPVTPVSVSGGGGVGAASITPVVSTPAVTTAVVECKDEDYIPLKLINLLSQGNTGIEIEKSVVPEANGERPKLRVRAKIPAILSSCIKKLDLEMRNVGNNVVISYRNNAADLRTEMNKEIGKTFKDLDGNDVTITGEYLAGLSPYQLYESCLTFKGVLKKTATGATTLDRTSPGASFASYSVEKEIAFDPEQPVKVLYATTNGHANSYGPLHGFDMVTNSPSGCLKLEELGQDSVFAYTREEARRFRLYEVCRGHDYSAIRATLSSLGNAPELRTIMERALEREGQQEAEKKYRELEELARTITSSTDEESIRDAGGKYLQALRRIDDLVMKPAMEELKTLLTRRREVGEEEKKTIDKRIKELNDKIGFYSRSSSRFKIGTVIDKLLEFGVKDEAIGIAELKLKSDIFSRVYLDNRTSGRGERLSFTQAEGLQQSELRRFETRATEAERMYLAKTGQRTYTREIGYRIEATTRARERAWQEDMGRIQTNMQACQRTAFGFIQNPARCNYAQRNQAVWQRQALSRRERFNRNLGGEMSRFERYNQYETEAQRRLASERTGPGYVSDGLGSYGMFEDYSGYDASSMYSMGAGMGGNPYGGGMGMGGGMGGGMAGNPYGGGMNMMGANPYNAGMSPY
ncbi:MAG: hypothetical protein A2X86_04875 [Bdellovibrionales bacterium GWA2_49_15]|nr:MAG: hypothetical protein A2X86_04875 [Bdellovibrionales bacterium GWA2_49_15]